MKCLFFGLLGSFSLLSSGGIEPIGGAIPLNPAATFPDPILADLPLVMDNHYQPPYYPGSVPYLKQIYYISNAYIGNNICINPFDENKVHLSIGQNQIVDFKAGVFPAAGTFFYTIGTNTFATSSDGGKNWSFGAPVEQIIPLGGDISQIVNASIGPGLYTEYAKNGQFYASGWGFFDMIANAPNPLPLSGFLFSRSRDDGRSWSHPEKVLSSTQNEWFFGPADATHPFTPKSYLQDPFEFYTTVSPYNSRHIHASTTMIRGSFEVGDMGSIYYFSSKDGGKTFSDPFQAYNLMEDPVWRAKYYDPDYTLSPAIFGRGVRPNANEEPNYFDFGGIALGAAHPLVVDQNVVLLPMFRIFPRPGSSQFADFPGVSIIDKAVARSLDNGKTWCKVAGTLDPILAAQSSWDPGFLRPDNYLTINGGPISGFFLDSAPQLSRDAVSKLAVSPATGRVYMTFHAANPDASPNLPFYSSGYILCASSDDQGATWSHSVQVNKTPSTISDGAQQAFSSNAVVSADGWYVVAYYDFRNWTGSPGEIYSGITPPYPPLPCDAWLAIYRETSDPQGGNTGIGLDFVKEIRLTDSSFDARSCPLGTAQSYVLPYVSGTPEGIALAFNKNSRLFVLYSTQSPGTEPIDTNNYKGMTVDLNGYYNLFLKRFQFPKPSNE